MSLFDFSTVPPIPTGVEAHGEIYNGSSDRDNTVATLHACLDPAAKGLNPVGTHPTAWNVSVKPELPVSKDAVSTATGFWFTHELPYDASLHPNTMVALYTQKNRMYSDGEIVLNADTLGARRVCYAHRQSFWNAISKAREDLAKSVIVGPGDHETYRRLFTFPYIGPQVACMIEQHQGQGWAGIHLPTRPEGMPNHSTISRNFTAVLDKVLDGVKPPWDEKGIIDATDIVSLGALLLVTLVALPIANRLDRQLAQDLAHLTVLRPSLGGVTDPPARKAQAVWSYYVMARTKALLDAQRESALYEVCADAVWVRSRMMEDEWSGKSDSKQGGFLLTLPYLLPSRPAKV